MIKKTKVYVQQNKKTTNAKYEVKVSGNKIATKTFNNKKEAEEFGRKLAKEHNTKLVIKNNDGKIRK